MGLTICSIFQLFYFILTGDVAGSSPAPKCVPVGDDTNLAGGSAGGLDGGFIVNANGGPDLVGVPLFCSDGFAATGGGGDTAGFGFTGGAGDAPDSGGGRGSKFGGGPTFGTHGPSLSSCDGGGGGGRGSLVTPTTSSVGGGGGGKS